jgi:hypothetical protein
LSILVHRRKQRREQRVDRKIKLRTGERADERVGVVKLKKKRRTCGGWIRGERGEGSRENKWKSEGDKQGGRQREDGGEYNGIRTFEQVPSLLSRSRET